MRGPPPSAAHGLCRPLLHLVRRHVLDVGRDAPEVPEGVLELTGAVPVELVLHRTQGGGARCHGGIEDCVWVSVEGCQPVHAIADEDMDRENDDKTSSVHFLRFELDDEMKRKLRSGAALGIGIDHPNYKHSIAEVSDASRNSLLRDLA